MERSKAEGKGELKNIDSPATAFQTNLEGGTAIVNVRKRRKAN